MNEVLVSTAAAVADSSSSGALTTIILTSSLVSVIVSQIFAIVLERFRTRSERVTESYRIFIERKHEIYSEYWKLLLKAIGAVDGQRGLKSRPDIRDMNEEDLISQLDELKIGSKAKSRLITRFNSAEGKPTKLNEVQDQLNQLFSRIDVLGALPKVSEANIFFKLNDLYFSNSLQEQIVSINKLLRETAIIREEPSEDPEENRKERTTCSKNLKRIDEIQAVINTLMRAELSRGHDRI